MKSATLILVLFLLIIPFACSKDFLRPYEKRLEGTWRLTDVDRFGFGSTSSTFRSGLFTFLEDGQLIYVSEAGDTSRGGWNISRRRQRGNCHTDNNGDIQCDDRYVRSLSVAVVDFTNQQYQSEFFDEINFTGTNRFNAQIYLAAGTCIFKFRRQ